MYKELLVTTRWTFSENINLYVYASEYSRDLPVQMVFEAERKNKECVCNSATTTEINVQS